MMMIEIAEFLFCTGFIIVFPIVTIRFIIGCCQSNQSKENGSGGRAIGGGLVGGMMEVDRITRPSIQLVEKVKEHRVVKSSIDGD